MRPSFFHHLHPATIPAAQARWRYTLGAGGLTVYLSLVAIATGVLLMFFYVPTPADAAASVQTIAFLVPFGGLVRNLHYWSAQALIVSAAVHFLRVVFTGAYAPPRRVNYLLGMALLVLILLLDFSGYMLRWDEGVRWALVAGANLAKTVPLAGEGLYAFVVGGPQPGQATLIRFYAWHIFGLTLPFAIAGVWHLFKVRRDGGIAAPGAPEPAGPTRSAWGDGWRATPFAPHRGQAPFAPHRGQAARAEDMEASAAPSLEARNDPRPQRITRVELVRREALAVLLASSVLLLLAVVFPAPLAAAVTGQSAPAAEARAPWFFLWVQQLLRWGDPFVMGVLAPALILAVLSLVPYTLPAPSAEQLGRWLPHGGGLARAVVAALILAMLGLTAMACFT